MGQNRRKESDSVVDYLCDPVSKSCDVNIIELHAMFRASNIVLATELNGDPPPALVVQFALVAAVNSLKAAITHSH